MRNASCSAAVAVVAYLLATVGTTYGFKPSTSPRGGLRKVPETGSKGGPSNLPRQSTATWEDLPTIVAPTSSTTSPQRSERMETCDHPKYIQEIPALGTIQKMLPKECFQINTAESLLYFGIDFAAVVASMTALYTVVESPLYQSLAMWQQGLMVLPLQILTGFAMWCMWCIGHDAGHGTVSNQKWINRIVGEVAHSAVCLTPFVPWAKSHLKHHLNHNHLERDYSHQWFVREEKEDLNPIFLLAYELRLLQLPFLYMIYLLFGIPDGGHVVFYGRMWQGESLRNKLDAAWSVAVSMATAGSLWYSMGTADFAVVCMVPWLVTSFWLFMVTYLQHHSDDGVLYTDDTWDFTRGAFETVDRSYGTWVNRLSHHMMDGHVAHHLFFSKIPHYKLEQATEALQAGLKERGLLHLYKNVDTLDFTQEVVRQFDDNWFFINENQVVRTNTEKKERLEYQKTFSHPPRSSNDE